MKDEVLTMAIYTVIWTVPTRDRLHKLGQSLTLLLPVTLPLESFRLLTY
jgi:hypothetical protein